jgi:putative DNA primase/helicase
MNREDRPVKPVTDEWLRDYESTETVQTDAEEQDHIRREQQQAKTIARRKKKAAERVSAVAGLAETFGIKRSTVQALVVADEFGAEVFQLTEDSLCIAFVRQFMGVLAYSWDRGQWYRWAGSHWIAETTGQAVDWARKMCRALNVERKTAWQSLRVAAAIEKLARSDRMFAMTADKWNRDPFLLATPAGTVDLRTGELRAANPDDYITRRTLVGAEEGEPRVWTQFLSQVTQGDEDLIRFLRQVAGYSLTGDCREECLFFLYGPGGNGKGTFVTTMQTILAEYAVNAPMDAFLRAYGERHTTDLAMLAGARLVTATETRDGRSWDDERVKALTGRDVITARFMRCDNFSFTPTFKLLVSGNHKPRLASVDDAWRRRLHVVPFTYKPPTRDDTLKDRLRDEYGQILSWAIKGCIDWQRNGLVIPARVRAETATYFESQDAFGEWLDDRCVAVSRAAAFVDLYASYAAFCENRNERPRGSREFGDELVVRGYQRVKDAHGIRGRGFYGIGIKP